MQPAALQRGGVRFGVRQPAGVGRRSELREAPDGKTRRRAAAAGAGVSRAVLRRRGGGRR
jgi:hypothetical protein